MLPPLYVASIPLAQSYVEPPPSEMTKSQALSCNRHRNRRSRSALWVGLPHRQNHAPHALHWQNGSQIFRATQATRARGRQGTLGSYDGWPGRHHQAAGTRIRFTGGIEKSVVVMIGLLRHGRLLMKQRTRWVVVSL